VDAHFRYITVTGLKMANFSGGKRVLNSNLQILYITTVTRNRRGYAVSILTQVAHTAQSINQHGAEVIAQRHTDKPDGGRVKYAHF